jgi:N-acetylmuramoyl-L-alanine amidase
MNIHSFLLAIYPSIEYYLPEMNPESRPSPRSRTRHPARANMLGTTILVAVLLATLFTAWTPTSLSIGNLSDKLALLLTPRPVGGEPANSTPRPATRIGIVAGHLGNDSGSVCLDADGVVTLTEQEMNQKIATLVQNSLAVRGFQVDLLQEYDTRLSGYRAAALVSIHNDSCDYINDQATGFKVAAAKDTRDVNLANRLTACLVDRYMRVTRLTYHPGSITADMTDYHTFSEIDPGTIAAIIETGFLNLDRDYLTTHTEQVADGIVQGILCFVNNENIVPTPFPK